MANTLGDGAEMVHELYDVSRDFEIEVKRLEAEMAEADLASLSDVEREAMGLPPREKRS